MCCLHMLQLITHTALINHCTARMCKLLLVDSSPSKIKLK